MGNTPLYEKRDIIFSNQEECETDSIIDPPFVRTNSFNMFNGMAMNSSNFFMVLFTVLCSMLLLGEMSSDIQV